MVKTTRWILVPFAAAFGVAVGAALAIPLNRLIQALLWSRDDAMPGKEFLAYVMPFDGGLAALLFVVFGCIAAPAHRLKVALALLIVGAVLAWFLLGDFHSSRLFGGRLWWPFFGTLIGGTSAVFIVTIRSWRGRPSNQAMQRTAGRAEF